MVTISSEEYADLIRAQHKLEMIIALKDELIYSSGKHIFNAIADIAEEIPTWEERETEFNRLLAETGKVETPEK